ncbi:hypothetical protein C8J57DRAFT_1381414 [Mycena rebaudengoi]|nr:hypothetical protein C8J57DRAFT_1381414 [Mycena rebaudengoi]
MSDAPWHPKRTLAEGSLLEIETCLIEGKVQRVYKNQWPSLRAFSLWCFNEHKDKVYVVFEKERYTYQAIFACILKAASVYSDLYGVKKGKDQMQPGLTRRGPPHEHRHSEYIVAFWACHLIGAVPVLTNASVSVWLPTDALHHCLVHTQCKLIMLDPERADRLEAVISKLSAAAGTAGVVVLESHEGKGNWNGMQSWDTILKNYRACDPEKILQRDPEMVPEDNALIMFTSGTTGLPKGVLSTQRQFLTNIFNTLISGRRAILRRGEDIPTPSPDDPQQGVSRSIFTTSQLMRASFGGAKVVLMRKWVVEEGRQSIPLYKLTLILSSLAGYPLVGLTFGGAPTADVLTVRARAAFPTATLSQGYGLTETNATAVSFAGEDYYTRPSTPDCSSSSLSGLPTPVNDILIMKDDKEVRTGELGEVWLRGPNIMQAYWRDPTATAKALTKDGWLKTGDIGLVDKEGFLYIRDRIKDIIIRGGENIDSVSVENALFTDGVLEVAAVGVPDQRLGELVAGVVSIKPSYRGKVTEASLIALARQRLPSFAVPVMILFLNELEHNPSGKISKGTLRVLAGKEWENRKTQGAKL